MDRQTLIIGSDVDGFNRQVKIQLVGNVMSLSLQCNNDVLNVIVLNANETRMVKEFLQNANINNVHKV